MRKFNKISIFIMSLTILFILFVLPVYAETGMAEQDRISVSYTTDKEQYNVTEEITATLKVTNNNAGSIYEVELEDAIPEGFELAEGSLKYKSIAELKSGESQELEAIYLKSEGNSDSKPGTSIKSDTESDKGAFNNGSNTGKSITNTPIPTPTKVVKDTNSGNNNNSSNKSSSLGDTKSSTTGKNNSNPTTGDNQPTLVYIVLVLAACVLIILLTCRKWKKFLALFLVLAIIESLIPGLKLGVKAANNKIQVTTNVSVDGESVVFYATVRYSFSAPNKQYDENNVGEIYYEPTEEEHIAVSEDETTTYADNELLVVAKSGVSKTEIMNLAAEYEAEVVGYIEQTRDYQWKFSATKTENEIDEIIKRVKSDNLVEDAYVNYLASYSECTVDEEIIDGEKWRDDLKNSTDSYERSWGVEAINAPATWKYFNENKVLISPVRVGLVDNGFDESHEDIKFADGGVFYNKPGQNGVAFSKSRNHGTHVAGTMAAVGTNAEGINGVYPYGNGRLFGVSSTGMDEYKENGDFWITSMKMKVAYAELIVRNVKVINQSQGFNWQQFFSDDGSRHYMNYNSLDELYNGFLHQDSFSSTKRKEAMKYADFLKRALNLGYEFVIVNAAGNTCKRESEYNSYNNLIPNNTQYAEVYNRIIVVGSIGRVRHIDSNNEPDRFEKYTISDFSDAGNRVDVFAPGECIYSTVPYGEKYDNKIYGIDENLQQIVEQYWSGTSMAAPHVAGVCANVWSINNDFTGEMVKTIVTHSLLKDENGKIRQPYTSKGIIDCKQAVDNAVYLTECAKNGNNKDTAVNKYGLIEGWVYTADSNGNANKSVPIPDATIKAYDQNGEEITINKIITNGNNQQKVDVVKTDSNGHYEFFLPQGTYSLTASKDNYIDSGSARLDNIVVESKQVNYVAPLVLAIGPEIWVVPIDNSDNGDVSNESTDNTENDNDNNNSLTNDEITEKIEEYVSKKEFMYGKSYTYTKYNGSNEKWDGIEAGQLLGYSVEDFDGDEINELLIVKVDDGFCVKCEVYEVIEGNVTIVDSISIKKDLGSLSIPMGIPHAARKEDGLSGSLSFCVLDSNHRIFLQYANSLWEMGGNEAFIASLMYKNNKFTDYYVFHADGTSPDFMNANEELRNLGVSHPDIIKIFDESLPLIRCFDGDAHEFVHAEQHTVDSENEKEIVNQTVFANTAELSANLNECLELYAEFLKELRNKAKTPSRLTFQLIYLDNDSIPELVIAEGHSLESMSSLYTIVAKKVEPITCNGYNQWGNHGALSYCEKESIVLGYFTTVSSGEYSFYRIKDREAVRIMDFKKRGMGNDMAFYVNGEKVSEEEYDSKYNDCGGGHIKLAGYDTGTVVSDESIQLLLKNDPICYRGTGGPF